MTPEEDYYKDAYSAGYQDGYDDAVKRLKGEPLDDAEHGRPDRRGSE